MRAPQQVAAPVARGEDNAAHQHQHGSDNAGQLGGQCVHQQPVWQQIDQPAEAGLQRLHQQHARAGVLQQILLPVARPRGQAAQSLRRDQAVARREIDDVVGFVEQRQQPRVAWPLQRLEKSLGRDTRSDQRGGDTAGVRGAGQRHDRAVVDRMPQRPQPHLLVGGRHGMAGAVQQGFGQAHAQQRDQCGVERHRCARPGIRLADDDGAVLVQRYREGIVVEVERLLRGHGRHCQLAQGGELRCQPGSPGVARVLGSEQVVVLVHGLDMDAGRSGAEKGLERGIADGIRGWRIALVAQRQHAAAQERGLVLQQL
ncbi:hypothetical protein D9M70_363150 [compost metagenome]